MGLSDFVLYQLATRWPSPLTYHSKELDEGEPGTESYNLAYARHQFNRKVVNGTYVSVWELDVLEIGCGHGGISCFLAVAGARSVTGIDLNPASLETAKQFASEIAARLESDSLPVVFMEMPAERMSFDDAQFDLVVADNLFEHVADPESVMKEAYRVLRPDGSLLVPNFSSILSKYGPHLKYGIKVPWVNLFFSEQTIIRVMHRLGENDPGMLVFYPGLSDNPRRIRDVRRYGDLNDITYRQFRTIAGRTGFEIVWFRPSMVTYFAKVLSRLPIVNRSILIDILSFGASACLRKTSLESEPSTIGI